MKLQGKVAVITGASRGIGRMLAVGFAREGAIVVAAARTLNGKGSVEETAEQISKEGGKALAVQCDVSKEEDIRLLIERTLSAFGRIDILVCNAGVLHQGPITKLTAQDFDQSIGINLRGPFLLCKYTLSFMMERRSGNIINVASLSAVKVDKESLLYGTSKAALNRFTLNLAEDVKPYNIAVNAWSPGLVDTEMGRDWVRHDGGTYHMHPPEAVVESALWLAQQDASTFTGCVVHRDLFGKEWP